MKMKSIVFSLILIVVCNGCGIQNKISNSDSWILKMWTFDKGSKKFIPSNSFADWKFLSYDSMIIAEGQAIKYSRENNSAPKIEHVIDKYTFIDLRARTYYEYLNFSDTAAIMDKFAQVGTEKAKGGWGFFTDKSDIELKNMTHLPDTTIEKIMYKRVRSFKNAPTPDNPNRIEYQIGYFRCDKGNYYYRLDNPLSIKMGCPAVRFEHLSSDLQSGMAYSIEFLPGKLTPEEIKVFEAWRKNARENPVNK